MTEHSHPSYWRRYRRVRSNVDEHLTSIYSDQSQIENDEITEDLLNSNDSVSPGQGPCVEECSESLNPVQLHVDLQQPSDQRIEEIHENVNLLDEHSDASIDLDSDTGDIVVAADADDFFDAQSNASDNSAISNDSDDDHDFKLADDLCAWVSQFNIPHSAVKTLLSILRHYHPSLPIDPRTLLKTKTRYDVVPVGGGIYHHFGIETSVLNEIQANSPVAIEDIQSVCMQLNIDGLPLFKSSKTEFWPILGRIVAPYPSKPFTIGLYCGDHKPDNVHEYLQSFIDEMTLLYESGIKVPETTQSIRVEISCVICDYPAKVYVKQVKGHSGYFGCDKCRQKGIWNGKMTFPETDSALRTDLQFDEMENEEHHHGPSPFRTLGLKMVSQFPIDYMHLVCLGVMKKLLWLWMKGPLFCRQGTNFITRTSALLFDLRSHLPREFLRKRRSLKDVDRWKATEFRQFLLYTGPVVLKDTLPIQFYNHFKLLYIAIYCLSSPFFCQPYRDYANQLLIAFVSQYGQLYGDDQYVYNVHGLVHLANDVAKFGELDKFSSFIFESYLGKIKRLVRQPNYPLQQIIRRLSEKQLVCQQGQRSLEIPDFGIVKKKHIRGPLVREYSTHQQFEELTLPNVYFSIHRGNNCILFGEKVGLVRTILSLSDDSVERILVIEWFRGTPGTFYTDPLHSSDLRIFKVSQLQEDIDTIKSCEVSCKCVLLPSKDYYVVVPLIHTFV